MRYYFILLLIWCNIALISSCKDDEIAKFPRVEGIQISPVAEYKELYPGAIVSFQYKVNAPEPVSSFKVQFKFPDDADFKDLPEYPELTVQDPVSYTYFQDFEYTLPASATVIDKLVQFKLIAKTANKTYDKVYTVRMMSSGLSTLRLYNPEISGYFKAQAIDLLAGKIVPETFSADSKDMIPTTWLTTVVGNGDTFFSLRGWNAGNSTSFKLKTKADFDKAPSTYAATYATGAEVTGAALKSTISTVAALTVNSYYIARVQRSSGTTYVGVFVKAIPSSGYIAAKEMQDFSREFLEIQIKK